MSWLSFNKYNWLCDHLGFEMFSDYWTVAGIELELHSKGNKVGRVERAYENHPKFLSEIFFHVWDTLVHSDLQVSRSNATAMLTGFVEQLSTVMKQDDVVAQQMWERIFTIIENH
eukprot:gene17503-5461_t